MTDNRGRQDGRDDRLRPRILYCHCANAKVLPPEVKTAVLRALCDSGEPFEAVADLCELAARCDPLLKQFNSDGGPVRIAACHPRAVKWLFAAGGASLLPGNTEIANMRVESAKECTASLLKREAEPASPAGHTPPCHFEEISTRLDSESCSTGGWQPWFPVIDYDRCTNCKQCLNFCLFGVYGMDTAARVHVRDARQCKTNCPACSRVCPEAAIIFPKHTAGPINGDRTDTPGAGRETMKVDISALLGGDLYAQLRQRSGGAGQRFSKERDPATALRERQRFLAALVEGGDIPPEMLRQIEEWKGGSGKQT